MKWDFRGDIRKFFMSWREIETVLTDQNDRAAFG
jgi:hypothetical protein